MKNYDTYVKSLKNAPVLSQVREAAFFHIRGKGLSEYDRIRIYS